MLQLGVGIGYADPTNIKDAVNDDVTTSYTLSGNETLTTDIGSMGIGKTEMHIESSAGNNFTVDGYDSATETRSAGITIGNGQTMNVNNVTLKNMESPADGGAIYNQGTLNITNSTFSNNGFYNPTVPIEGKGAAIYNEGALNITDTTFSNNMAPMYDGLGGGLSILNLM